MFRKFFLNLSSFLLIFVGAIFLRLACGGLSYAFGEKDPEVAGIGARVVLFAIAAVFLLCSYFVDRAYMLLYGDNEFFIRVRSILEAHRFLEKNGFKYGYVHRDSIKDDVEIEDFFKDHVQIQYLEKKPLDAS